MTSSPGSWSTTDSNRPWFGSRRAARLTRGAASTMRGVAEPFQQFLFGDLADVGAVAGDDPRQRELSIGALRPFEHDQSLSHDLRLASTPSLGQPGQPRPVLVRQIDAGLAHLHATWGTT